MSEWAPKRFWKAERIEQRDDGWAILLDARQVNTPHRTPLILPTRALAEAIAGEWAAQEDTVRPDRMPLTRAANSALDKVTPQAAAVAQMLLDYGETDLVCYRADAPEGLVAAEAEAWDPLVDWARNEIGAPLVTTVGSMHRPQPEAVRRAFAAEVTVQDAFALTALHDLVTLSGSLVIGLAAQAGYATPDTLWGFSQVDERWQESQWGQDDLALAAADAKRREFLRAAEFHVLSRHTP